MVHLLNRMMTTDSDGNFLSIKEFWHELLQDYGGGEWWIYIVYYDWIYRM